MREGTWRLPLIGRDSRCIALSAVARPVSELFTYARQHPDKRFVLDEMSTATHSITAKHYADFFRQRPANVSVPTSWDESHPPLAHSHRQACLRPRDRFWDIPVPKIDSAFDNLLVPQQSWSPSTTQQPRKLVAAPYLAPI
ncbi:hypothetical protein [Thiolapillus sp.]|uniref:hypothetical protein n=1 Tax=Thiolapillus sp. TaxID=2017437 RepID=UPI003AF510E2